MKIPLIEIITKQYYYSLNYDFMYKEYVVKKMFFNGDKLNIERFKEAY